MSESYLNGYFDGGAGGTEKPSRDIFSDASILFALVLIFALMILPLPLFVIDMLVAFNITAAIFLLLTAIYIRTAIEFTVFPPLLLISTLLRLALSVATTRMILIEADAGAIIQTFGTLVTGSNIVVGLVIFLIITVVQFIVIAKGSERVAEVSARFSLDGMPGKQMSIDSDLRSGLITKEEAREKRADLEIENRLHGSLDGAMKFVKGDAIASIIIIMINLIGGLTVGVLQKGMPFGDALTQYSILTVGDGLVAQIPALLSALSAGLIVTRSSQREHTNFSKAVSSQMAGRPRVFFLVAIGCLLMGMIPGFPTAVFMVLASGCIGAGLWLTATTKEGILVQGRRISRMVSPQQAGALEADYAGPMRIEAENIELKPVVPLLLEVDSHQLTKPEIYQLKDNLNRIIEEAQIRVGIKMPGVTIFTTDMPEGVVWRLNIHELAVHVQQSDKVDVEDLARKFQLYLLQHSHSLLGMQGVSNLLNIQANTHPDLVNDVIRHISIPQIYKIFNSLLQEGISIRDLQTILEALAQNEERQPPLAQQIEIVRAALAPALTRQYARSGGLRILRLEPGLEQQLTERIQQYDDGMARLGLHPEQGIGLVSNVTKMIEQTSARIIMTNARLRRPLWQFLSQEVRDVHILSYAEILPTVRVEEIGHISLEAREVAAVDQEALMQAGETDA